MQNKPKNLSFKYEEGYDLMERVKREHNLNQIEIINIPN